MASSATDSSSKDKNIQEALIKTGHVEDDGMDFHSRIAEIQQEILTLQAERNERI